MATLPVQARFLGWPAFEQAGQELACSSRKALLAAAYVLLTRRRHTRAALAELVWGRDSRRHGLGSLRVALTKLPAPVLACLDVTRRDIGIAAAAPVQIDVEDFIAHCASDDLQTLARAVAGYRGDLLQGADDDMSPEFADWLLAERTRVRQIAHEAHLRVAQRLAAGGEREGARQVVDAWLRQDPASEEMHRLAMSWLPRDQALAQYEVYRRARAVAHGAAPSEAMAALADRLRHGADSGARELPVRLTAATSFIGRGDELAELRALLADPACRLLTLHGMGGVGKTRLAAALVEMESAAFADDAVHIVALDAVQSPALFAQAVARACGLQPSGAAAPMDLVAGFLNQRPSLLLLDNVEHLLGPATDAAGDTGSVPAQLAALLAATGPHVKVLATSREALQLQEEWLYEVSGLACPGAEAADAQAYPAVQFFAQRARQADLGFSLAAELPNVVQIATLLEGLPLGLELAASWVRSVPCAEIAAGLREHAQGLRNRHVNRSARHASLAAAVDYSWRRLPPEQREALMALAVLRGSFSRECAEFVARANLRTLSALAEKSLLQRAEGGRWHLHEVVRQFAWEQFEAGPKERSARQAAVRARRDDFFLQFLQTIRTALDGAGEAQALAAIETESPNIREAWHSLAEGGRVAALEAGAPAWFELLEARSFIAEGSRWAELWLQAARAAGTPAAVGRALVRRGLFQRFGAMTAEALSTLDEAVAVLAALAPPGAPADLAQARSARAFTLFLLGRLEEAEAEAAAAIALGEALGDAALVASGCRVQGLAALQRGRREEGRTLQQRALEAALRIGKPSLLAAAQNNLALAENHLGHLRAAEAGYEGALALWRELGFTVNVGRAMHNLGVVATRRGDHATALARYRAAYEALAKAGERNLIALNLMSTGDALVRLGRPEEARAPLGQALRMAQRDGHALPALNARIVLAQAALALGQHAEAAQQLVAVLEGTAAQAFANVQADAVVTTARLLAQLRPEEEARALAWAGAVSQRDDVSLSVRQDALAFLGDRRPGVIDTPQTLEALGCEARGRLAPLAAAAAAPARPP